MGDLVGYMHDFSNWFVYDVNVKEKMICQRNIPSNETRVMNNFERKKLESTRKWAINFFKNHSIKKVMWWNKIIQPNDEN